MVSSSCGSGLAVNRHTRPAGNSVLVLKMIPPNNRREGIHLNLPRSPPQAGWVAGSRTFLLYASQVENGFLQVRVWGGKGE